METVEDWLSTLVGIDSHSLGILIEWKLVVTHLLENEKKIPTRWGY